MIKERKEAGVTPVYHDREMSWRDLIRFYLPEKVVEMMERDVRAQGRWKDALKVKYGDFDEESDALARAVNDYITWDETDTYDFYSGLYARAYDMSYEDDNSHIFERVSVKEKDRSLPWERPHYETKFKTSDLLEVYVS